jgi:ABC-2 type transport system permease protein
MSGDVWTVAWKEWREIFARQGRFRGGVLSFALALLVFGVLLPWQLGRAWVESPALLLSWAWVPLLMLSSVIVDAIAGERERHTLETLLASPLGARSILAGKILAAVGYGLAVLVSSLALGLVTVNVLFSRSELLLYPLPALVLGLAAALVLSTLVAAVGVLVSLRAASVRQASHGMGLAVLLVGFAPLVAVRAASSFLPGPSAAALLAIVAFASAVVLDALLLGLAFLRFTRARLVLEDVG